MMVYYRRARTSGGSYFFTLALQDRTSSLLIKHIHSVTTAFRQTRTHNLFITLAIVILPEHLHVLWQLPPHDCDYSKRWRQIKTYFTQAVIKQGVVLNKNARGEYNLWQQRFWEHQIRDARDLEQHINYSPYAAIID